MKFVFYDYCFAQPEAYRRTEGSTDDWPNGELSTNDGVLFLEISPGTWLRFTASEWSDAKIQRVPPPAGPEPYNEEWP